MKQLLLIILVITTIKTYGQVDSSINIVSNISMFDSTRVEVSDSNKLKFDKNYFEKISIKQRKTASTLLLTGTGLILSSFIIGSQIKKDWDGLAVFIIGSFFGLLTDLISIPFFISSKCNSNKAKAITW